MFSEESLFQFANSFAMLGWILLIIFPSWRWTSKLVNGVVVAILALLYAVLVFGAISFSEFSSFGSLEGVMELFTDKKAVLVGWVHYLAFDLFVGRYITYSAKKHGISHLLIIPCLLLTFMLGPTGLLLYLIIKTIKSGSYFGGELKATEA